MLTSGTSNRCQTARLVPAPLTCLCLAGFLCLSAPVRAQAANQWNGATPINPQQQPEGLIHLDVTVITPSGQPVIGFPRGVFTLVDNGQPTPIVSFAASAPNPAGSLSVVILMDTLRMSKEHASEERAAVEQFLNRNGGHLAVPVSLYSLADSGFSLVASPSLDGNALAMAVQRNRTGTLLLAPPGGMETESRVADRDYFYEPTFSGLRALAIIGTALRQIPGHKLLLWLGPGPGIGTGVEMFPNESWVERFATKTSDGRFIDGRPDIFKKIEWFALLLREAPIVLDTISYQPEIQSEDSRGFGSWRDFLKPAPSPEQAEPMDLNKDVLALQSGGQALTANDVARQIADCIREQSHFYTLTFNPPVTAPASEDHSLNPRALPGEYHPLQPAAATQADEYHAIQVHIDAPDVTVHTDSGYYDEPWYADLLPPRTQDLTIAKLQQLVDRLRTVSDRRAAQQISFVHLTERLSSVQLDSLQKSVRGKRSREALQLIAAPSAFLDPPASAIPPDRQPGMAEQQQLLTRAIAYLNQTIPRLPNFFAMRTSLEFSETPAYDAGVTRIQPVPLHLTAHSRGPILYRQGEEVVSGTRFSFYAKSASMQAYGTFGPLLGTARAALSVPHAVAWSRWEQTSSGRRAVFRFAVPAAASNFLVTGCCLPEGDGTHAYAALPAYHGEIALDPASGAILRIMIIADLRNFVPERRAEMMVSYGPVTIGGRTYVLPLRSISLLRVRTVENPAEWEQDFRTWGPCLNMLTEFTFGDYHMYRAAARILPGVTREPDSQPAAPPEP